MKTLRNLKGNKFPTYDGMRVVCTSTKSSRYYKEGEVFVVEGWSIFAETPRNYPIDQAFDGNYGTWEPYREQLVEIEDML